MSQTKHTPGPWMARKGAEDEPERWIVVADNGTRPYHIATIENGQPGDTCETEGHTARLIAAAPEMKAVIIDCIPTLEMDWMQSKQIAHLEGMAEIVAIKKARLDRATDLLATLDRPE